ncbi:unnamed protein product [Effrenium voratum]|nr:unnamed protein product [Effrenium voratum]CAJ1447379.1 unnamed protein product [Effrenium voratum]CAJ1459079.1 unnamed protein product [Effrenium voratum]CAJ1460620.1 unnamed protein product [Effrenium voratum]
MNGGRATERRVYILSLPCLSLYHVLPGITVSEIAWEDRDVGRHGRDEGKKVGREASPHSLLSLSLLSLPLNISLLIMDEARWRKMKKEEMGLAKEARNRMEM